LTNGSIEILNGFLLMEIKSETQIELIIKFNLIPESIKELMKINCLKCMDTKFVITNINEFKVHTACLMCAEIPF